MVASTRIVQSYAHERGLSRRAHWDYQEETPLHDARGFTMGRETAHPSQLTDEDLGLANVILTNGARFYVDHAHPEYSSPEVTSPLDIVRWEKAGERIMAQAAIYASQAEPSAPILLYKNNIDNKGASYGSHENYLVARSVPFQTLVSGLMPFLVSRQILCGSGRVGRQQDGSVHAFQISQRADYIETEVGLETTLKRPIVNTRDEPHADPAVYRRLHLIIGDANMAQTAIFIKHATTSLMLALIESGRPYKPIVLGNAVRAVHDISHDPELRATVSLSDGRQLTALDLQWSHFEAVTEFLKDQEQDWQTQLAMSTWENLLTKLGQDPAQCFGEIDWITKLHLLNRYRDRDNLEWSDPTLHLVDLQYHDIRPDRGVFHRLATAGRIPTLVSDNDITSAMSEPPTDTRAYFRGRCLEKFSASISAASWDSVIMDLPGRTSLLRIPTIDPLRGTQDHVKALFDEHDTVDSFVAALTDQ